MGGKTATSTSQVAVPPQVLAEYQSVNNAANSTAAMPFQAYGSQFVAPTTDAQNSGISQTMNTANEAQPYYGAATNTLGNAQASTTPVNNVATGLAAASGEQVNANPLTGQQINSYLSPYLNDVLGSTEALQNQSNQQQQAGQLGNAINSGAFGSDRTGIAAANLEEQQNLANNSTIANIANTGYMNAQGVAQQQQGVSLGASQANRAALGSAASTLAGVGSTAYQEGANTANELGSLGSGAQSAATSGANAEIAAGTVQQQTQQAQDTALYNQFLQQQSYPFQVDQFLANIAEGTGSLSGSTTTTQQPGGFFSDRNLKRDIQKIGKTYDGQTIYSYKMGDDNRTRIGLIAQEVEKKHPGAVGVAAGFKMVDYGKATDAAANKGHFYSGGVVQMPVRARKAVGGYAGGDGYDGGLGAVLAAQQNMYAGGGNQQHERQMPTAGVSHNLAVAQGVPSGAPKSGMDNVTQGISTVNNGMKMYKQAFPTSSAPPAAAGADSGLGAATATGTSASSGASLVAGGSDVGAGVGADAAAAGAGDAAAGAAGGAAAGAGASAAAGAAGTAVAGAGTEAAADAAAALAAEYAAADVATVAVMAAARGGSIRKKYDSGGSPYGDPSGGVDIPDDPNQYTLQKAGPIQKQKTGLQTMMYMGDPNNSSTLMGDTFSNSALARGGVAGRGHYDDGGDVAPEPSADDMAADPVPTENENAAPAPPQTGVAAGSSTASNKSWWDKAKSWASDNKEALIPILTGLGAMGTAKTVHPGVALAAGLEEAGKTYLGEQVPLATSAYDQSATQGENIANQMAALKYGVAKTSLQPQGSVAPYAPAPQSPTAAQSPTTMQNPPNTTAIGAQATSNSDTPQNSAADLYNQYKSKYFTNTARTPEEQAQKDQAIRKDWAIGGTSFAQQADNDYQTRVGQQILTNQNAARQDAAGLYAQATDQNALPSARSAAAARYNTAMQFTGEKYASLDGSVRNDTTFTQPVGTAAQTLTPAQLAAAYADANSTVTVGNNLPVKKYSAAGFNSPQEYIAAQKSAADSGNPGVATQGATSATGSQQFRTPSSVSPATPNAMHGQGVPAATNSQPPPTASNDPYLIKALSDPQYNTPPLPTVVDQTSQKKALDQQGINVAKKSALLDTEARATDIASNSLQYLKAAQQIMQSKGAPVTGLYGSAANLVSRVFGGTVNSQNYQEVAKWLSNAAAQQAQQSFPGATQNEVGLQFETMSPHATMDNSTIEDMIATNIRVANYGVNTAKRAVQYANKGLNPQTFPEWNQQYYSRDKMVNSTAVAVGPNGDKLYRVNGKWIP